MDQDDTWERLIEIFRDFFDDPELSLERETTADAIEDWDSISHVELMVAIEEHFGVRFRTGEIASLADVGALADKIRARRSGSEGTSA